MPGSRDGAYFVLRFFRYWRFRRSQDSGSPDETFARGFFFAFTALAVTCVIIWGILTPPPPGGDPFIYNLTFPASWLSSGSIHYVQLPFGAQAATYYPLNTELFYLWIIKPWHEDFLVNCGQTPFWILSGLAVAALARETGVGRPGAVVAGTAAMLIPGVIQQATVARVDIAMSAWLLISIYFALRWSKTRQAGHLLLFGLCVGLLVGTKSIGILYSVVPGLIFLNGLRKRKLRVFSDIIIVAALAAATGGFWYIRNWMITGNPLFPLNVELAGRTVFAGAYGSSAMQLFRATDNLELSRILSFFVGLPMTFLLTVSSSVAIVMVLLNRREGSGKLYLMAAPWLLIALFWFINPYNNLTNGRFLFPAFMLLCYSLGVIVHDGKGVFTVFWAFVAALCVAASSAMPGCDHLPRMLSNLLGGAAAATGVTIGAFPLWITISIFAVLILIAVWFRNRVPYLAAASATALAMLCIWTFTGIGITPNSLLKPAQSALVMLIGAAAAFLVASVAHKRKLISITAATVSLILLVAGINGALAYHREHKYDWYRAFPVGAAWAQLDKMTEGDSLTIASVGNERAYGLFGTRLRHNVITVNVSGGNELGFHDYWRSARREGLAPAITDRPQWHRENGNAETWIANLREAGVDLVFATTLEPMARTVMAYDSLGFPPEVGWAESRPDIFRIKYANSQVRIFALKPDAADR